jgi:hypothetical protein
LCSHFLSLSFLNQSPVEDTWPQVKELLDILSNYPEIKSLIGGVLTTMAPEFVMAYPHVQCYQG